MRKKAETDHAWEPVNYCHSILSNFRYLGLEKLPVVQLSNTEGVGVERAKEREDFFFFPSSYLCLHEGQVGCAYWINEDTISWNASEFDIPVRHIHVLWGTQDCWWGIAVTGSYKGSLQGLLGHVSFICPIGHAGVSEESKTTSLSVLLMNRTLCVPSCGSSGASTWRLFLMFEPVAFLILGQSR